MYYYYYYYHYYGCQEISLPNNQHAIQFLPPFSLQHIHSIYIIFFLAEKSVVIRTLLLIPIQSYISQFQITKPFENNWRATSLPILYFWFFSGLETNTTLKQKASGFVVWWRGLDRLTSRKAGISIYFQSLHQFGSEWTFIDFHRAGRVMKGHHSWAGNWLEMEFNLKVALNIYNHHNLLFSSVLILSRESWLKFTTSKAILFGMLQLFDSNQSRFVPVRLGVHSYGLFELAARPGFIHLQDNSFSRWLIHSVYWFMYKIV